MRQLCLNSKEVDSTLLSGLLRGIVLKELMLDILNLDNLQIFSAEVLKIKRRMRLFFHLLCTFPALDRRRKRHLGSYNMEDLDELDALIFAV